MFDTLQILILGAAVVIETVLLLVLLERRNRHLARVPILVMVAAAWLWHFGLLALFLMVGFSGPLAQEVQWVCLVIMALGLFLMPCGMTHAAARLARHGTVVLPRPDRRYALAYLPLLGLVPLLFRLNPEPDADVLAPLLAHAVPYVLWSCLVKALMVVTLLRYRNHLGDPLTARFFGQLAGVLVAILLVQASVFLVLLPLYPQAKAPLILLGALTPLAPIVLLAYFVLRYNFLQLMLERTFAYGGLVAGAIMFHQIAFHWITGLLPPHYHVPLIVLEVILLTVIILVCRPLRQRIAEALRYLLGHRVFALRERLRGLATEMTTRAGQPPAELLSWFTHSLRGAIEVDYMASWLFHPSGEVRVRCGDSDRLRDDEVAQLFKQMQEANLVLCTPTSASCPQRDTLRAAGATLAVFKKYQNVSGLLLIGRLRGNQQLSEETTNAVLLLVEQLAITADNSLLHAERLAAERRALQSEKLSELGLVTSSIAHEVKNPLSAIKTIATVLAEDLGPDSPHAESLNVILGEVDRLAIATNRILDFARPKAKPTEQACVGKVVLGTLQVLQHRAREQDIAIDTLLEDGLNVTGDESLLREIFFNLLANSLDAAGPGGRIHVGCRRENGCVVTEVRDSGPGIPIDLRDRLFEPFVTSKPAGTGLGLYVVGRHVRELGGEIGCASGPEGTSFLVKLRTP